MCRNQKTPSDEIAAARAAGREPIDSALQRNPIVAIATSVLTQILSLLLLRGSRTAAIIRKMKLESYSYLPVKRGASPVTATPPPSESEVEPDRAAAASAQPARARRARKATPPSLVGAEKGGTLHGQN